MFFSLSEFCIAGAWSTYYFFMLFPKHRTKKLVSLVSNRNGHSSVFCTYERDKIYVPQEFNSKKAWKVPYSLSLKIMPLGISKSSQIFMRTYLRIHMYVYIARRHLILLEPAFEVVSNGGWWYHSELILRISFWKFPVSCIFCFKSALLQIAGRLQSDYR